MPSNKNRERIKQQAKRQLVEATGKNELIYRTVALVPVLENNEVIYKVMELSFTMNKTLVSMEEIDSSRTQGTALNKLENAFSDIAYNITQLRKVVRELRKDSEND